MKGLRTVFIIEAIYLTIIGFLFTFLPSVAETIFQTEFTDPIVTPIFGQVVLVLALVCYLTVPNVEKHIKLTWALIFDNAGHIAVFVYLLATGIAGFVTVGPPMIISAILLVLFVMYYRKASA